MRSCLLLFALLSVMVANAQHTIKFVVRNDETKQNLAGITVTLASPKKGTTTDIDGVAILQDLPAGKYEIKFSGVGFLPHEETITVSAQTGQNVFEIKLEPLPAELAEIVVQTTRTNQSLDVIPTRIEALPPEELDEKGTMRPGDIKMLLGEATGIYVQPTSPVSGTASFKMQGLDSRYVQLLRDGMPLYQGYSGSLSLMQISPLDLKQVEFIKGTASTLYGGGAIAGLINLISKTPVSKPELIFLLNGNSGKGLDASGFYSQKWQHTGTTVFSTYSYNMPCDPGNTGFSAIPATRRFTLNPKLFIYADDKNSAWVGLNTTYENRRGGDMQVLNGETDNVHQYFEQNVSYRFATQLSFTHKIDSVRQFNVKNTLGYFNRSLTQPSFYLKGVEVSSYTEANYVQTGKRSNWIAGLNFQTDKLTTAPNAVLSNFLNTIGLYAQNTYNLNNKLSIESGLRTDKNNPGVAGNSAGVFILPRIYTLYKINEHFSTRFGGGLGYKMPALINNEDDAEDYRYTQPLNLSATKAERSYGTNADVNYKGIVGDAYLNVNQMFFYTRVNDPLLRQNNVLANGQGYFSTRGAETNIKFFVDELGIYVGYTYTDSRRDISNVTTTQPLVPKHQLNADVTYEIEGVFRAGVEGFYTGPQALSNSETGRGYWTFGLLLQKMWRHFDVFVNAENLTDVRQSKWAPLYTGSITTPVFKQIYTPLEGAIINAGIKIKLLN